VGTKDKLHAKIAFRNVTALKYKIEGFYNRILYADEGTYR